MRRRPSADPTQPQDDWLARANRERAHRDAAWRQQKIELTQQAAARAAWRPEVEAIHHVQRPLRGTRDR